MPAPSLVSIPQRQATNDPDGEEVRTAPAGFNPSKAGYELEGGHGLES